jgi:hypothetical protein
MPNKKGNSATLPTVPKPPVKAQKGEQRSGTAPTVSRPPVKK